MCWYIQPWNNPSRVGKWPWSASRWWYMAPTQKWTTASGLYTRIFCRPEKAYFMDDGPTTSEKTNGGWNTSRTSCATSMEEKTKSVLEQLDESILIQCIFFNMCYLGMVMDNYSVAFSSTGRILASCKQCLKIKFRRHVIPWWYKFFIRWDMQ